MKKQMKYVSNALATILSLSILVGCSPFGQSDGNQLTNSYTENPTDKSTALWIDGSSFTPILRFIAGSDVHIAEELSWNPGRYRLGYLFDDIYEYASTQEYNRLDAVILNGDLCERGTEWEYKTLMQEIEKHARQKETLVMASFAGHEILDHYNKGAENDAVEFITSQTGIDPAMHLKIKGFHFVVVSNMYTEANLPVGYDKQWVLDAFSNAAEDGGNKPIFTFFHHPVNDTILWSGKEKNDYPDRPVFAEEMKAYPQMVYFSGHYHSAIRHPATLVQTSFTSIDTGAVDYYSTISQNKFDGVNKFDGYKIDFSNERDSVLSHLIRIVEYLISNLDEKTNCLRSLYGDWNDALDGLGRTEDKDKDYGSGVSVMATLQLYRNLGEISKILKKVDKGSDADRYENIREQVRAGLQKYAIVENNKGERKILHGWGDKREYFVGSFFDNDGQSRDSLTSNSFWVLCGALDWDDGLKKDILSAYTRLDSKYGLKTFEPYFSKDNDKVGRIKRLPKGTAENGATYIHATLFGIWSLFEMDEEEKAWEQLYKILPITHEFISTTPFVMPNSYVENSEKGFDGESMSDWFTGSGCVLVKILLWYVFGIRADLDGVKIQEPKVTPFDKMKLSITLRGKPYEIISEKNK